MQLEPLMPVPPRPPLETLFADVYADRPWHLAEQQAELEAERRRHADGGHAD